MTKDEILSMAKKAGFPFNKFGCLCCDDENEIDADSMFERFAALVAEKERETCAKLVEEIEARCVAKDVDDPPLEHVAAAIRARNINLELNDERTI
jgi:hypothetical protein